MQQSSAQRTACLECDLLVSLDEVQGGQRANCPRCQHLLTAATKDGFTRALAFALAAAVLLIMANSFPFLALKQSGLEKVMTIPGAGLELYRDGFLSLAVLVLGPILVIPSLMLFTILLLVVPLRRKQAAPWLVAAGRFFFAMNPWSMVEVFIIGVLVSLVKIGAMATVVMGISFWAYIGFGLCFITAISSLDRFQVWRAIEECQA
jgi:paraquat-inducible protein A